MLVGGVSSALQHAISLDSGWSVVNTGHQHAISLVADWCAALIDTDFPFWCVVLSPLGQGLTRPLFGLGMGPDNTSPWQRWLASPVDFRRWAEGLRPVDGAASTSTPAALRCARPGDGAASSSSLRRLPLGFAVSFSSLRDAFLGVVRGSLLASRFSLPCSFLLRSAWGWGRQYLHTFGVCRLASPLFSFPFVLHSMASFAAPCWLHDFFSSFMSLCLVLCASLGVLFFSFSSRRPPTGSWGSHDLPP